MPLTPPAPPGSSQASGARCLLGQAKTLPCFQEGVAVGSLCRLQGAGSSGAPGKSPLGRGLQAGQPGEGEARGGGGKSRPPFQAM